MNINFVGKNIEVTDSLRDITTEKFARLDKYFEEDVNGSVTFSTEGNNDVIEVTIDIPGTIIRVEESTEDMYTSIDKAIDVVERQVRKHKDKLRDQTRTRESIRFENIKPLEEKQEEEEIVRRKRFDMKPMMEEEAILQMEMLNHNFFVFLNGETDMINVVYKRKGGHYGIIEPELM